MWATEIPKERAYGLTRCCCVSSRGTSLYRALVAFGLEPRDELLTEVPAEVGAAVLERILAVSFVGQLEAMSDHRARALSAEFVDAFKHQGGKFYTNGDWSSLSAHTWTPLTDSVFDGGLIAHGPDISACVWVEEDD